MLAPHTAQLTRRDRFAMLAASTAGITLTIIVITGLMVLKERHSALTFWLTCLTYTLSLTVVFHPETPRGIQSIDTLGGNMKVYPEACGRISPAALCGPRHNVVASTYLMLASVPGMPLLLIWLLRPSVSRLLVSLIPRMKGRIASSPYLDVSIIESYTPPPRARIRKTTKAMAFIIYAGGIISICFFMWNVIADAKSEDVKKE
jgi:hypothetical protein